MREDDGRDVLVREVVVLVLGTAKETVTQATASSDGDGGEEGLALDVTNGVDAVDVGVLVLVDNDVALLVNVDTDLVEANAGNVRVTANSPDKDVDLEGLVRRVDVDEERARGRLLDLLDVGLLVDVKTLLLGPGNERVREDGVKGAEDRVVADEEVGLGAKAVEDASELDGNVAGTDDSDALGLRLDVEEAVRVDAERSAGDLGVGGDRRLATDGNDNLLGLDLVRGAVVLLDVERVLVDERGVALVVVDLVVGKVTVAGMSVCDRQGARPQHPSLTRCRSDGECRRHASP